MRQLKEHIRWWEALIALSGSFLSDNNLQGVRCQLTGGGNSDADAPTSFERANAILITMKKLKEDIRWWEALIALCGTFLSDNNLQGVRC